MDLTWYLRRLSRMGPREIAGRTLTAVRVRMWRREFSARVPPLPDEPPQFFVTLPVDALKDGGVPSEARQRLLATADRLMDGHAEYFGVTRDDMVAPDWSFDPKTGLRAPTDAYAFDIAYRDEREVGDIKQLWEPSRHQHLTVLAAAYAVSGDDRYAHRVADHLKSWWAAHPPMHGLHWISGIELGIRLMSWVWVRRLLADWPGVVGLFEENPEALHQIRTHQRWLDAFPSRGSSANNHVIAEDAGQLAAACAFDWFPESPRWRASALTSLDRQLHRNTFPSGLNREQATEYHGLVLELGLAAAIEARAAGVAVPDSIWDVLTRMIDAAAAVLDTNLQAPRQGDGDDGHGLVVDGHGVNRWSSLLATGEALFGRQDWWPHPEQVDVRTVLLVALAQLPSGAAPPFGETPAVDRPVVRPDHYPDAGLTLLRTPSDDPEGEIWCRCDAGPHGFLSIAAHAHADALSVEVRHDGVQVLADPGCYCYHGEPAWRSYFRSTVGHNTLQLDGLDQSRSGGPFLWVRHARSRVASVSSNRPNGSWRWSAEHDGYSGRGAPVVHRRSVELAGVARRLRIVDEVSSARTHRCTLAFHLGPLIEVDLSGHRASLRWSHRRPGRCAVLDLPDGLTWSAHRGETTPPLGWYSPGFGWKEPTVTLLGEGAVSRTDQLVTTLEFLS